MQPLLTSLNHQCRVAFAGGYLTILVLLCMVGCAQNPVSGGQDFVLMSEEQELRTGRQIDQELKKQTPIYDHNGLAAYVEDLGLRMAKTSQRPDLPYRFTVLDSTDINAFALPGGYTYITRGIMAYLNSEAELAAVLGHELGHVTARHSVKRMASATAADVGLAVAAILLRVPRIANDVANLGANAFLASYSRDDELQADQLGMQYVARIGLNPEAAPRVVQVLKAHEAFDAQLAQEEGRKPRLRHGVFASHPDNEPRLAEISRAAGQLARQDGIENAAVDPDGRARFLARIDGMVFGDNAAQGVVRNNVFMHPELGIALRFPPDWRVVNRPDRVIAIAPQGEVQMTLQAEPNVKGKVPADMLKRGMPIDGEIDINPIPSMESAIATGSWKRTRAAIYILPDPPKMPAPPVSSGTSINPTEPKFRGFYVAGVARTEALLQKHFAAVDASLRSFHVLSEAERMTAVPLRLKVVTASAGSRYAELAKGSPIGKHAEAQLRLMNGHFPTGEPIAGQLLKVVE